MNIKRGMILVVVLLSIFSSVFALDEPFSGQVEYAGIRITNNDENEGADCGADISNSPCYVRTMDVQLYCEQLDGCLNDPDKWSDDEYEYDECTPIGAYLDNGGKHRGCPIISGLEVSLGGDDVCSGYTVLPGFNFNTTFSTMEEKTSAFNTTFDLNRQFSDYGFYYQIDEDVSISNPSEEIASNNQEYLVDNALLLYFDFFENAPDIYKLYFDSLNPSEVYQSSDLRALPALLYPKYRAGYGTDGLNGVLCGNNNKWIECNSAAEGRIYIVDKGYSDGRKHLGPELFICQEGEENEYSWNHYDDNDGDGYSITDGDCNDNPVTLGSITEGVCPEIDFSNLNLMTIEKYQQEINGVCSGNVKYSTCSACINPSAHEVCGDNINNDCQGVGELTNIGELVGDTPDNCNLFQAGCERRDEPLLNEDGEEIQDEAGNTIIKHHNNIFNKKFSWIDTPEGGYCCGYNGKDDLGLIKTPQGSDYERICLPDKNILTDDFDNPVIGYDQDLTHPPGWDEEVGDDTCEGKSWCWVKPDIAPFHIITLKNSTGSIYDVVSNNNRWLECKSPSGDETPYREIAEGLLTTRPDYVDEANRFYCYQEADRWSWAECLSPDVYASSENSIKTRKAGEGLFALHPTNDEDGNGVGEGSTIPLDFAGFEDYLYRDGAINTGEFNRFEFMVRFKETPALPASVKLTLLDKNNVELFSKDVLNLATNGANIEARTWMHLKTEIPTHLYNLKGIIISSDSANILQVKDAFFSTGDSPLCSGRSSLEYPETSTFADTSAWITEIDSFNELNFMDGKLLCNQLYDSSLDEGSDGLNGKAWLGGLEISDEQRRCCGDDSGEYYAGEVSIDSAGNNRGCWNSQVIQEGESLGMVEFEATYSEAPRRVSYQIPEFNYQIVPLRGAKQCGYSNTLGGVLLTVDPILDSCENTITEEIVNTISTNILSRDTFTLPFRIPYSSDPYQYLGELAPSIHGDYFRIGSYYLDGLTFDTDSEAELYFRTPSGEIKREIKAKDYAGESTVTFQILVKKESIIEPVITSSSPMVKRSMVNFTCSGTECLYPLPGDGAVITIKNPHPDLYDLYFVTGSTPEQEFYVPAEGRTFSEQGNLKAKRVSQQVVYHTETTADDALPVSKFYGCQPADYLSANLPADFSADGFEEKSYCENVGDYICSFGDSKDGYTTMNTWSTIPLTEVGYTELTEDASPEDLNLQLRPADASKHEAELQDRSVSARMTPGLNILPNANLVQSAGRDLYFWEFYQTNEDGEITEKLVNEVTSDAAGTGILRTDVSGDAEETIKQLTLPANTLMVSDKLSILEGETYQLSHEGTCQNVKIDLYNSEGTGNPYAFSPEDGTGMATLRVTSATGSTPSHLIVTFSGEAGCTVLKPILQILDGSPAPYNYNSQYDGKLYPRSATSCCPENYCWNGYACVAPMTDSVMAEVPGNGNYYRCVDGQWYDLPLLSDWNGEKQGFCQEPSQCFVLSTNSEFTDNNIIARPTTETDPETTLNFHAQTDQVKFPNCVNQDEFIMDHYCGQDNQWTSRTKFLANELLQYPGRSDFALYCTNPYDALEEFDHKEDPYIYGSSGSTAILTSPLGGEPESLTITNPRAGSCFQIPLATDEDGGENDAQRLIPLKDNTCINSVCVLKHEDGKSVFSTTLNKPVDSEDSFLKALDLENTACNPGSGATVSSSGASGPSAVACITSTPVEGELNYLPKLNAVIYGKEGIARTFSFSYVTDRIGEFFADFFGVETSLSASLEFVETADNFRDLYILNHERKAVRAIKETLPKTDEVTVTRKALIADYENFDTPLCEFVNENRLSEGFEVKHLQGEKLDCLKDGNNQRVEVLVTAGNQEVLDQLWPQLTGKLRPRKED